MSTPKDSFFRQTSYEGPASGGSSTPCPLERHWEGQAGSCWENCYRAGPAGLQSLGCQCAPRFAQAFDGQVGGLALLSLGKARPPREALIGSVELHAAGLAKMCDGSWGGLPSVPQIIDMFKEKISLPC